MSDIELNSKDFKTLSSETRLNIIKALDGKKLSLNDIARVTNLHKMTLHEHLTKLVETGYVKRHEREGHKWVYYKLTWKGTSLIHPRKSKVIIIFSVIFIVCIGAVGADILLNISKPMEVQHLNSQFEGITIQVVTDKEIYNIGEDIRIGVILSNTNTHNTTLYCDGYKNHTTGELFTMFHIKIYTETYGEIWALDIPGKYDLFFGPASFTLLVNGSSSVTYDNVSIWNQTAKNIYWHYENLSFEHNKQVPPGSYNIVVEVPISMSHYFEMPYKEFYFGNSKKITIT